MAVLTIEILISEAVSLYRISFFSGIFVHTKHSIFCKLSYIVIYKYM